MNEELCMCHAVIARQHKPVRFEWKGPTLWAIYPDCEEHHEHFVSPGWHRTLGQVDKITSADQALVKQEALRNDN
jgi:hypothetical protein